MLYEVLRELYVSGSVKSNPDVGLVGVVVIVLPSTFIIVALKLPLASLSTVTGKGTPLESNK
jgi:hypothetical protein